MMFIRSVLIASLATIALAAPNGGGGPNKEADNNGHAATTCATDDWVPLAGNGRNTVLRCCAGDYDDGHFASCDTSSCVENFNQKPLNCFNYGSVQHPLEIKGDASKPGGSANCPFLKSDKAICDTTYYDMLNGKSCRLNTDNDAVHCLGKVKCDSAGVKGKFTGKSKSDGTDGSGFPASGNIDDIDYGTCENAGMDCFYNGASENFKVCLGDAAGMDPEDEPEFPEDPVVTTPEPPTTPDGPPTQEDITTTHSFTQGDPHFKTHGGEMYDFHGGCDMVLVDNPDYKNGLGMHIQIRTKIETWWSYVASAAVRIGDDTFEVIGGNQEQWLYINGVAADKQEEDTFTLTKLAGLQFRYKRIGANREAHIYIGNGEKILVKTYNDFVKVDIAAKDSTHYTNSLGLLGRFPDGKRVGRDGQTFIEDVNAFGQEWQVKAEEPQLFHTYEGEGVVKPGQMCAMPTDTFEKAELRKRRLESGIAMEDAEQACAHLGSADMRKACVDDIVATQDINMASVW